MGALFFCFSLHSFAQDWKDKQWLRLLDYRETLFGYESEADDDNFFISPEGKYSPERELQAFIHSLYHQDLDPKKNSICRFPARVSWLKKFMEVPVAVIECKDYLAYKNLLSAKSASVVFSSYYLNNPASSFGHTFLRIGKKYFKDTIVDDSSTELLDMGINYGAITGDAHPVVFAIGGLSGFFYGNYNAIPYYYKVREYNDFETRDLWSYDLKLTKDEIDMIVDHIWELAHTKFRYYFLTENCSYHVLSILEAAKPSLELHQRLPTLYTIPSVTLKALMEENLVDKITFRPSASTLFYHQLSLLNPKEKREVKDLVYKRKKISESEPARQALIYDTAISLVDYKFAKKILKGDEEAQSIKRPLLVSRSKIPLRSPTPDFSYKMLDAPHLGHPQKRLMLGQANKAGNNYLDLEWRFAFHDLLDYDVGFPQKTTLEVMKIKARTDGHDYQLRDFILVNATSLGKFDSFTKSPSWKVKLGQWQTNLDQTDLTTQGVLGGMGLSYEWKGLTPYALIHGEASYVSEKLMKMKLAYGTDTGLLIDINHNLKIKSEVQWRAYPWNESRLESEGRFSNSSVGMGAYHNVYFRDGVHTLGIRLYKYL